MTVAAVLCNLVASLIDREQGTVQAILSRTRVRLLVLGAIVLTAIAHGLMQL